MSPIEAVYIACYRHDVRFARACVASVRHWHPDVPVFLIKDHFYGAFDTREIERCWNVGVMDTGGRSFNWGFSKLEALFLPEKKRCLVLDADVILAGPVISALERYDEDFVVQDEDSAPEFVRSHYYDIDALRALDPAFTFPGHTFNTGQLVVTTGLLRREDFDGFVRWGSPPALEHAGIFQMGEQGLLNYVLQKKAARGEVSLRRARLMEIPSHPRAAAVRLAELGPDSPHDFVIHWCGEKMPRWSQMERGDIALHFERLYYSRVPLGGLRGMARNMTGVALDAARNWMRRSPAK
jgi:hypothetical protein